MLDVLRNCLVRLRTECLTSGYEVLLEADVSGWLFHLLLTDPKIAPQEIHLDTRVCSGDPRKRFDVAVGSLVPRLDAKPCIRCRLVVEVKIFPRIGFTAQQHRVHYQHAIDDDLPKLAQLDPNIDLRAALIVDGAGYLEGTYHGHNRADYLISVRDRAAPGVHVFTCSLANGDWALYHSMPAQS